MIFNNSEYNPLYIILTVCPLDKKYLNTKILEIIQSELFKGGIVPEDSNEFTQVVNMLIDLKKEINGKSKEGR